MLYKLYVVAALLGAVCLVATSAGKPNLDCQAVEDRITENIPVSKIKGSNDGVYGYSKKLEALMNFQIKTEMGAFYEYTNMAAYFHRFDMDLPGFHRLFKEAAEEELKHAHLFMDYQNKRGGTVQLMALASPGKAKWPSGLDALHDALALERSVTHEILCLHKLASDLGDQHAVDFLETNFIPEQYDGMKDLATKIATLERISKNQQDYGLAEFHFDKTLQK